MTPFGIMRNPQQVEVFFNLDRDQNQIIPVEDIKKSSIQTLFYKNENRDSLWEVLGKKHYLHLQCETELNKDLQYYQEKSGAVLRQSLMLNNLQTLKHLIPLCHNLLPAWKNDRLAFFEEIWHQCKLAFGAQNILILFNDLKKNEPSKNKLVRIKLEGSEQPNPTEDAEFVTQVLDQYRHYFDSPVQLIEYDKEKRKVVFAITLNSTSSIIMLEGASLTALNRALFEGLINGLNDLISTDPKAP